MQEFNGGGVTTGVLKQLKEDNKPVALILGRSGVLRMYVLPLAWGDKVELATDALQRIPLNSLRNEAVTGKLIMAQSCAVVTVSRGMDAAYLVPASPFWNQKIAAAQP